MPNNAAGPFSFWEQLQDWYPAQDPYGFAPQPIQRSGPMGPPVPAGARAEERTFTPMPVGHSEVPPLDVEWLNSLMGTQSTAPLSPEASAMLDEAGPEVMMQQAMMAQQARNAAQYPQDPQAIFGDAMAASPGPVADVTMGRPMIYPSSPQAIFGDAMAASRQPTGPMGPPVPASARARGRTFSPELIERSAPMGPPVPAAAREAADQEWLARWTPQAEATQQGPYFDPAQAEVLTLSPEAQAAYNQQLLAEHSGRGLDPMSVEAAQAREYDRSVQLAQQIRQARAEDPAPKKRATSKKGRRSKKKEQKFRPITPDWAKETAPKKKVAKKGKGKSKRKAKEWQPETPAWAKEPARPRIADMFLAMPQSVSAPLPPASGPQMMRGGPVLPR